MLYCYNVIMCNLFVFSLPIFGILRTMELAFKRNPDSRLYYTVFTSLTSSV